MTMAEAAKFVVITSGAAAIAYMIYKFFKCRNITQVPASDNDVEEVDSKDDVTEVLKDDVTEVSKDDVTEVSKDDVTEKSLSKAFLKDIDVSDPVLKDEVQAEGVKLWIDECVEEYYSINPGPSFYDNIKQEIFDRLMDSNVWNERNPEIVKRYVQDYLDGERSVLIPKDSSIDASDASLDGSDADVSSSQTDVDDSDDESDLEQEIENMCNRFFGITYQEYRALEEERAKELTENDQVNTESISSNVAGGSVKNSHVLEEKDNTDKKKSHKKWKKFKKRIANFFKGSKSK